MQLVLFLYVNHLNCHELVGLVVLALVDVGAVAQTDLV